ncbi:phosphoenolpyruvate carboxykinase (ATP) [Acetomicrobium flavidum]|uniref:phosphoenolpyruvate carboxykinase (ATP) n=1 Tax=Acetomicrobium flavidum TaxID=49896 RepID=A0ABY1JF62_9BACT|nr:phosphoenolpyruvate carboxykinase (ATP) [Acetomicrobium flavidum]
MATMGYYQAGFEGLRSRIRVTVEAPFYGNNVVSVGSLREAYGLAKDSPGTVELTGMPVFDAERQGLPEGANVLLFNDGGVVGRCAAARRIIGEPNVSVEEYASKLREAVYGTRFRKLYHVQAVVGLDLDFMVKAHLLIPEGHENILYNWLLNFQYLNERYSEMYRSSKLYPEGDIFVFSDPDWQHPDHPLGLALFDPLHNCAAILGMRYFGEFKKGTLTLAWGTAARNGFLSCHGGLKRFRLPYGKSFVMAVFGLSGSGKSTITHAKHNGKYDITVLHDDAFVVNREKGYSIALEPTYFDKTQDYTITSEASKYIVTLQNNGVTVGEDGKLYAVMEDIRNGNGRAIRSRFWSPNRADRLDDPINALFWIMRDPNLPPVVKVTDPCLGSTMGATLATRRTTAERLLPGIDPNALVFEPYANPFRVYPLSVDYEGFKHLLAEGVDCYVLNTGEFMGKKIESKMTLEIIEAIVEERAHFVPWEDFSGLQIMEIEGFVPNFKDENYREQFAARIKDRIKFVKDRDTEKGGFDKLPPEAGKALEDILQGISNLVG